MKTEKPGTNVEETAATRTQRLKALRRQTPFIDESDFNAFQSESFGGHTFDVLHQQPEETVPEPRRTPLLTLLAIWPEGGIISPLRQFVAQWFHDDGWDLTKPRLRDALRLLVPDHGPGAEDDDDAFCQLAVNCIEHVFASLALPVPSEPHRRGGGTVIADLRRMETTSARFRRPEKRTVGGKRFAFESSRFAPPRGDRSGRLHTLRRGPPPAWCTSAKAMLSSSG